MSQDITTVILLIGVVAIAMFFGVRTGLRERQSPTVPLLGAPAMLSLYWACGGVQAVSFVLIVAAWQHWIAAVWGQVGAALALSIQLLTSVVERRRSMIILNCVVGVAVLTSIVASVMAKS